MTLNSIFSFLVIQLAVVGFLVIFFQIFKWLYESIDEAKEKGKRIEFTSVGISLIALIVSIISLMISLAR